MSKSRDAFRTISEVSDALETPAHVLRFWESKFSQIKPVKRAGGRRYYRPSDMDLLAGIKKLLHEDGLTIKGAQKLLREQGVKNIAAIGADQLGAVPDVTEVIEAAPAPDLTEVVEPAPDPDLTEVVEAAPRPDAVEKTIDAPVPAPLAPQPDPEVALKITNVVPLASQAPANDGPRLSLNLSPKAHDAAEPVTKPEPLTTPEPSPADVLATVPADPSDSDSKAPARLFHLLQKAPRDKLAAKASQIAPLLARMKTLRDSVQTR